MRRVRIPSIAEVERHAIFDAVVESNGDKLLAALYVRYRKNNPLSEAQTI
jgi:hypothetical protein